MGNFSLLVEITIPPVLRFQIIFQSQFSKRFVKTASDTTNKTHDKLMQRIMYTNLFQYIHKYSTNVKQAQSSRTEVLIMRAAFGSPTVFVQPADIFC